VRALKRHALLLALALGGSPEPSIVAHAGDIFEDAADAGPYCDIGALVQVAEELLGPQCSHGDGSTICAAEMRTSDIQPCDWDSTSSGCYESLAAEARQREQRQAEQRRIVETCRAVLKAREKK
jgi:hypothetical protein